MLSSLLRAIPKSAINEPAPEDYFQFSLGLIFTDDLQNQHGDPDTIVRYRSNGYGDLDLEIADPNGETERTKFAHYLWNAGVLAAELVGGRDKEGKLTDDEAWGKRSFVEGKDWWVSEQEQKEWDVKGETVIELGAGVGLAGIMSCLAGAKEVTITDYPAPTIIKTLKHNVEKNIPNALQSKVAVQSHKWSDLASEFSIANAGRYTRIIAADTLWLQGEHTNLAHSMLHFLSPHPSARIFVMAGFHTGRARMAGFFEETVPENGLEIEEIYELDADGRRREWNPKADGEMSASMKKWLAVARLKRK